MAFELKPGESVSDGIRRNVKRQIEKALEHLGTEKKPHARSASDTELDARQVRKCFKKVRAALRLVREDLGDDVFREENLCFRDAGRLLRELRDAKVLVETVDRIASHGGGDAERSAAFGGARKALIANLEEVTGRVVVAGKAPAAVKDAATRALARLPDWRIQRDGWAAMETGLRQTYRAGHRALAIATKNANVGNLHEWRKQIRHLRNQLQLLEAAWATSEKGLDNQTRKLAQLLGDDHDLAILREMLAADPVGYGGHRMLKAIFVIIDREREELEREAFALGRELYKESPKIFTDRIGSYWKAWAGETEAVKPSTRTRLVQDRKAAPASRGQRGKTSR